MSPYQKLINLEMSYKIIRDRYKELYIKLYGKKRLQTKIQRLRINQE